MPTSNKIKLLEVLIIGLVSATVGFWWQLATSPPAGLIMGNPDLCYRRVCFFLLRR